MMLPAVTLQLTAMLAESPVLMNPTAVKSAVAFWRRVRILGETSRSAIVPPGSVARTGNSHATIAAVTSPARDARTTRSFSRARRDDSLCLRSEEHTSELQSPDHLVCRLLLEKKNQRLAEKPSDARTRANTDSTQPQY